MTAAYFDEDELLAIALAETEDNDYGMDEELLLGPGGVSRTTTLEYETEILSKPDADSDLIGNDRTTPFEDAEKEELDYEEDEEEEREERAGKFTSERKQLNENSNINPAPRKAGGGNSVSVFQRGGFQNRGRGMNGWQNRGGTNRYNPAGVSGLPSLMTMPLGMGPSYLGPPGVPMSAAPAKILINPNFQQPQPLVRLNIPGVPTINMPPPSLPINTMQQNGPIIPRLPNGIPLIPSGIQGPSVAGLSGYRPPVVLPPNHGMAGFGVPPPMTAGYPPNMPPTGSWDQAVHQFLCQPSVKSSSRSRKDRRRSRSSSYSSGSSYSGSSRSRSRSRSPRRHRREEHKRTDRDSRRTQRGRGGRDGSSYKNRGVNNNYRRNDRYDNRYYGRRNDKMVTDECAKAVGVDTDYLNKMAEQKRQREEIIKRKEQRRTGFDDEREMKKHPEPSASVSHEKVKPCLCVHARGLQQLPTAKTRVEAIAKEVGSVKKCWQWDADQITVVFADLNHAKEFTMKYNGKVLSGLRMSVTMTKEYLNLNNIR